MFMDPAAGIEMSGKLNLFFKIFHFYLIVSKVAPYKMNSFFKCTFQIGWIT